MKKASEASNKSHLLLSSFFWSEGIGEQGGGKMSGLAIKLIWYGKLTQAGQIRGLSAEPFVEFQGRGVIAVC